MCVTDEFVVAGTRSLELEQSHAVGDRFGPERIRGLAAERRQHDRRARHAGAGVEVHHPARNAGRSFLRGQRRRHRMRQHGGHAQPYHRTIRATSSSRAATRMPPTGRPAALATTRFARSSPLLRRPSPPGRPARIRPPRRSRPEASCHVAPRSAGVRGAGRRPPPRRSCPGPQPPDRELPYTAPSIGAGAHRRPGAASVPGSRRRLRPRPLRAAPRSPPSAISGDPSATWPA